MKIYANQLNANLAKQLSPCYLIFGDEPFQIRQARSQIKQKAQQLGFAETIRLTDDDQFDWQELLEHCQAMSLFSSQKFIELELNSNKVGKAGSEVLKQIVDSLGQDTVLVLFGPKLDSNQTKSAWFKALDKVGTYIPVYDIDGQHLVRWLQQQCQQLSLNLQPDAQQFIINFTSGNLLACAQELEKLKLLYPNDLISLDQVKAVISDQSRFSVFQLADKLLAQDGNACVHILSQLKNEELEPNIILWALKKEISIVSQLQQSKQFALAESDVFSKHRVWKNKQSQYSRLANMVAVETVQQCLLQIQKMDQLLKFDNQLCAYTLFSHICLLFSGQQQLSNMPFPSISEG